MKKKDGKPKIESHIKKRTVFVSIVLIAVLGFLVYSNSLDGKFLWDDHILIGDNAFIRDWSMAWTNFTRTIGESGPERFPSYRPIQAYTYMVDYSLWEKDTFGYHLTNIALHVMTALALYWLILTLCRDSIVALFTGLFFVIHPIHTEAVAYVSGRADPLVTLFLLLSLVFYIRHQRSGHIITYILMAASYLCALFSRENSFVFPLLVLLYHYAFRERIKPKGFISVIVVTVLYFFFRVSVLGIVVPKVTDPTTFLQRLPGVFVALTNYIRLLFVPFHLHMVYGNKLYSFADPKALLGAAIFFSLLFYAFKKRKEKSLIFFSVGWFVITLLPQSNLFPLGAYMAEHWLYLPSIGFFLILVGSLTDLYRSRRFLIIKAVILLCLLSSYSYLTFAQSEYWKDPVTFCQRTLTYAPDSFKVYNTLGNAYNEKGMHREAIAAYRHAVEIDPNLSIVHYNLGNNYASIGMQEEAIEAYKRAIEIDPQISMYYNNLGAVYDTLGESGKAFASFARAIEVDPYSADAHSNLGAIYATMDKREEAIKAYMKAISINPDHANAYNNLGMIYSTMGRMREAIAAYKKAIEIHPANGTAHLNLAIAYYHERDFGLAVRHCDEAIALGVRVERRFLELLQPYRTERRVK